MATLRQRVLNLANYQNGSRILGPVTVRTDDKYFYVEIARCTTATPTIWPNVSTKLSLVFEVSTNDAVTWVRLGAITSEGGIVYSDKAQTVEAPVTALKMPLPINRPLQIRANTTITGGPLRTEGFYELRD